MSSGTVAVSVSIASSALAGIVLVLRCASRVIIRRFGIDDALAIVAYLSSLAVTIFIYLQNAHGLGHDITTLQLVDISFMLKYLWASIIAYGLALTIIKISALLQYLRFLVERPHQIICWTMLVSCSGFSVACLFVNVFECRPITFMWDKSIKGECIDLLAWWYCAAAITILTDIIIVAIPIFAIKHLTMPRNQKRALLFVFALGGFGCVIGVLRLHSVYVAATSTNITKDNAQAAYWSSLEVNIAITCTSLPPLKALVAKISPSLFAVKHPNGPPENVLVRRVNPLDSYASDDTLQGSISIEKKYSVVMLATPSD